MEVLRAGMEALRLRPIEPADLLPVARLWRRSRQGAMPRLEARMGYLPEDDLRFLRDVVLPQEELWVAGSAAEPLGFLALGEHGIERLYVDPPAQGRGVGRALLALARERRSGPLFLFTHRANERARRFYERHGFQAVAFGMSPPPESEPDVRYRLDGPLSPPPRR